MFRLKSRETVEYYYPYLEDIYEAVKDICAAANMHCEAILYIGAVRSSLEESGITGLAVSKEDVMWARDTILHAVSPSVVLQAYVNSTECGDVMVVESNEANHAALYSAEGRYYFSDGKGFTYEMSANEVEKLNDVLTSSWDAAREYDLADIDLKDVIDFYNEAVQLGNIPAVDLGDSGMSCGGGECEAGECEAKDFDPVAFLEDLGLLSAGKINIAGYLLFGNGPVRARYGVYTTEERFETLDSTQIWGNVYELYHKSYNYIRNALKIVPRNNSLRSIPMEAVRELLWDSFAYAEYTAGRVHEICVHPDKLVLSTPGHFSPCDTQEEYATRFEMPERNRLLYKAMKLIAPRTMNSANSAAENGLDAGGNGLNATGNCTYEAENGLDVAYRLCAEAGVNIQLSSFVNHISIGLIREEDGAKLPELNATEISVYEWLHHGSRQSCIYPYNTVWDMTFDMILHGVRASAKEASAAIASLTEKGLILYVNNLQRKGWMLFR